MGEQGPARPPLPPARDFSAAARAPASAGVFEPGGAGGGVMAAGGLVVTGGEVTNGAVILDTPARLGAEDAVRVAAAGAALVPLQVPARGQLKPLRGGPLRVGSHRLSLSSV